MNDKRTELLDQLSDYVLANGLAAASLRPMAKAAGTSDRMLLYYFPDKEALIGSVLGHIARRLMTFFGDPDELEKLPRPALTDKLYAQMISEAAWPYARLWLEMAAQSAAGDTKIAEIGATIGRSFRIWGAAQLACDEADREREGARLLIEVEGRILLYSLGLSEIVRASR